MCIFDNLIDISIHSLHTEGDPCRKSVPHHRSAFQSTPSTRRETFLCPGDNMVHIVFQSTPSTRRETCPGDFCKRSGRYFNPLPPHGGRRGCGTSISGFRNISIHSLHTEGDKRRMQAGRIASIFQSTPSTRRETIFKCRRNVVITYFNPLPPHGGRPFSTLPSR